MPFFLQVADAPVHVPGFAGPEGETVSPHQVIEFDHNPDESAFRDVTPAPAPEPEPQPEPDQKPDDVSAEQAAAIASQVDGKQPVGADGDPAPTSPHDPAIAVPPFTAS